MDSKASVNLALGAPARVQQLLLYASGRSEIKHVKIPQQGIFLNGELRYQKKYLVFGTFSFRCGSPPGQKLIEKACC